MTTVLCTSWVVQAKLSQKAPFSKYSSVDGLKVVYGNPADPSTYPASEAGAYDVVYDNNGKDMASCQPMIDHFKVGTDAASSPRHSHSVPSPADCGKGVTKTVVQCHLSTKKLTPK